jgi:hypothetical protein
MTLIEMTAVLGNLGEFIGSIAVLATLIYLALQVKHSKELLERQERVAMSQVYQHRTALRVEIVSNGIDPALAEILVTLDNRLPHDEWKAAFDRLSEVDKRRARSFIQMNQLLMDNSLYQGSLGMIDEVHLAAVQQNIRNSYPLWEHIEIPLTPRTRAWYEAHKDD